INRSSFKEKTQVDSYSIKQVFDDERQDLAIFSTKAVRLPQISNLIVWRDELLADPRFFEKKFCRYTRFY
ncbi:MAG: hypothetical protein Q4G13_08055, partial [Moraxella sp.]|nr:hypothetical protein [Moraxella sp.]